MYLLPPHHRHKRCDKVHRSIQKSTTLFSSTVWLFPSFWNTTNTCRHHSHRLIFCRRRVYRWIHSKVLMFTVLENLEVMMISKLGHILRKGRCQVLQSAFLIRVIKVHRLRSKWQKNHGVIRSFDSVNSNFKKPCYILAGKCLTADKKDVSLFSTPSIYFSQVQKPTGRWPS